MLLGLTERERSSLLQDGRIGQLVQHGVVKTEESFTGQRIVLIAVPLQPSGRTRAPADLGPGVFKRGEDELMTMRARDSPPRHGFLFANHKAIPDQAYQRLSRLIRPSCRSGLSHASLGLSDICPALRGIDRRGSADRDGIDRLGQQR